MCEPSGDDLRQLARQALGPEDGDTVAGLALQAVRLEHIVEATGHSRLGAAPLMKPSQAWPTWDDRPLSFIALLDLEDFAGIDVRLDLPPRALLNFFYEADEQMAWGFDPEHADGWRVLLADPDVAQGRPRPDGALEFAEISLGHRPVMTLPDPFEPVMDDTEPGTVTPSTNCSTNGRSSHASTSLVTSSEVGPCWSRTL